jgi:DNA polymerase-4
MLDYLMDRAVTWLRFHDRAVRGLSVTIRYGDYESAVGREAFRRPVHQEAELKEAARDRFERLYQRRLPLRLIGIELSPVVAVDPQLSLFPDPEVERRRRLTACVDQVRQRFGFTSVLNGAALLLTDQMEHDRENLRMRTPCLSR